MGEEVEDKSNAKEEKSKPTNDMYTQDIEICHV